MTTFRGKTIDANMSTTHLVTIRMALNEMCLRSKDGESDLIVILARSISDYIGEYTNICLEETVTLGLTTEQIMIVCMALDEEVERLLADDPIDFEMYIIENARFVSRYLNSLV